MASKKALVLRWGAWGDLVIASPVFRLLKEDGYHVTAHVTQRGEEVLRHNPHIDRFIIYKDNTIPNDERLEAFWNDLSGQYDKFINLSGSLEEGLLRVPGKPGYDDSKEDIHAACNVNYYDRTLELAGYGHIKGLTGEMYFSPFEERLARDFMKKYRDKFVILWGLSGSSPHKAYPYAEIVGRTFLDKYPDSVIMLVGDALCDLLAWSHDRTKNYCDKWPIRKSLIMAKYADYVVTTETALSNAAGCFDTPKAVILSHSSKENLTKYWKNCTALEPPSACYPCHKMHYSKDSCKLHPVLKTPTCAADIKAIDVFRAIEGEYLKWREKYGRNTVRRGQVLFAA